MKFKKIILALACLSTPLYAENDQQLQREIQRLQHQAQDLQTQLDRLQKQLVSHSKSHEPATVKHAAKKSTPQAAPAVTKGKKKRDKYYSTHVTVHAPEAHPESIGFYPTALVADNRVVTYIAGTPVVSSPYLGDRPAFDGSDYIVNISSINRDIRLMQQRRRLYRAYQSIGYPVPQMPIIALSGKSEPVGVINNPFRSNTNGDLTLGSSELDIAAALNQNVEAYIAIAYDESPPAVGPRINNSAFNLNMGFVNIGNLDKTPLYFTAGQLYVPFGRYSSSMISAPLTMNVARTKTRPFILGYKSQEDTGPFAAVYAYRSDTILGRSGVGGVNLGYIFEYQEVTGEIGASYISSIDDAAGMQSTGSTVGTTFGGFGSITNGNEAVRKTQAMDVHGNIGYDRYNFTAEWVGATQAFRPQDLSFNGRGARPQAAQAEVGMTFRAFNRPSSIGLGYQWSKDALALNLPQQRYVGVFNISIWKDTVESLEYRHDIDYGATQFANGAAPAGFVNLPTLGTGRSADTVSAQIGVYF
ncbi:LbtU family siderophore porin [Legionella bononiensis]|uniref:LbtU family siderophore porin n=1 Tax=Legionella bononiensis TaxID=2793102 RepID=A0ABS1WFP3_9GAMM|nr:LbtU family siderophore porin [Legionella bononiensis]MBL7481628.1 LbtU family siderophore porin [Legionella bononiensis]MBL7528175.1 LbtU family siderophore porin [Legionella bononiensis]MBL7562651.1 LbtU family siderophore porin [Legionella bononiensis]